MIASLRAKCAVCCRNGGDSEPADRCIVTLRMGKHRSTRWVVALLWAIGACGVHAAETVQFELPPLNQPPTKEHHPGKIIWADLVTTDLEADKRFYGALFGWTFNDIQTGSALYAVATL